MFLYSRRCKQGNVIDVARAAGNFNILLGFLSDLELPEVSSARSMTLLDYLKMIREVTIYAPSDEAWAKLPKETFEGFPAKNFLALISRHFITGVIAKAADIPTGLVKTFGGESIYCINNNGNVSIDYRGNLISVVTPDVMASNGVIHVIDKVILPPPPPPTPILPGLNLCIPNLYKEDLGRYDPIAPIAQVTIVQCGANEMCQKIGEGQFGQYG